MNRFLLNLTKACRPKYYLSQVELERMMDGLSPLGKLIASKTELILTKLGRRMSKLYNVEITAC